MTAAMIASVRDEIRTFDRKKPWLILGKGPTSDLLRPEDSDRFHIFSLNHACLVCRPAIAHFVDWAPFLETYQALKALSTRQVVCLPWRPHLDCRPTKRDLASLLGELPADVWDLRICSYNAPAGRPLGRRVDLPDVAVHYFSAEAGFAALGLAGVREVHSLGVDGGTQYGKKFDGKDRLANGRTSFDVQFGRIEQTLKRYGMKHVRLGDARSP
jgi:hypothetical protein